MAAYCGIGPQVAGSRRAMRTAGGDPPGIDEVVSHDVFAARQDLLKVFGLEKYNPGKF